MVWSPGSVRDLKNNLHTARGHDCNKFFKLLNADQSAIKFLIYDPMLIMFQRGWREGGGIDPRREGSGGEVKEEAAKSNTRTFCNILQCVFPVK